MPDNSLFSKMKSLFGGNQSSNNSPPPAPLPPESPPSSASGQDSPNVYTGEKPLIRRKYLWGTDNGGTPCFLVLIGEHTTQQAQGQPVLLESVTYTDSVIFRGSGGHFPAFEDVRALNVMVDRKNRTRERKVFLKRDARNSYWADPERALPDSAALNPGIAIPYYSNLSHRDCAQLVLATGIAWNDFTLAEDPGDILQLEESLFPYCGELVTLFASPNLYLRKKTLRALVEKNPPAQLWKLLLERGSSELIAGLFLEFALAENGLLLPDAREAKDAAFPWLPDSYAGGIRRAARLYCCAMDEQQKAARLDYLRDTLPQLRMRPLRAGGKNIPEETVLEGAAIRKFALQGAFQEYYYEYNRQERRSVKYRREGLYPKGAYCDGVVLDRIQLKNTIQEMEVYGAADLLGAIAYYLDAPGLAYHLQGSGQSKALAYFRRYLTRILNGYAQKDEDKFMQAMVRLLTGYAPEDYCCKFPGNFQFNYFIKYYLYHAFDATPPEQWYGRYNFMREDQLQKAQGRFDFRPEIWNRHLDKVVEIAIGARVETILRGIHAILADPANAPQMEAGLSYQQLAGLAASPYPPLADMGLSLIQRKLAAEGSFRADTMAALMRSDSPALRQLAREYFQRSGGAFSPEDLAGMLLLPDLEEWEATIQGNLLRLDGAGYIRFLQAVLSRIDQIETAGIRWDGPLSDILNGTLHLLESAGREEKTAFFAKLVGQLQTGRYPKRAEDLAGMILFALSVEELSVVAGELPIDDAAPGAILSLLRAVRNGSPPQDRTIVEILETGSTQMIRVLVQLLETCSPELQQRFSTLLLLLECDVSSLNDLAKSAFDGLPPEEQKKLHVIVLDSPVQKAYAYGLEKLHALYESREQFIPAEFIVKMMEHPSPEVRGFIAGKVQDVLETLGGGNQELFLYYAKTMLLLPNRLSGGKDGVYAALPRFVGLYGAQRPAVEGLLLEIGGSNVIRDSERALVALAQLRKEAV